MRQLLNPSENSIACAIVLSAYVEALQSKAGQQLHKDLLPSGNLFPKIVLFLERFDPVQVRYVGSAFRDLLAVVVQAAEQSSQVRSMTRPASATANITVAMDRSTYPSRCHSPP